MERGESANDVVVRPGNCVTGRWLFYLVHTIAGLAGVELVVGEEDTLLPDLGRMGGATRVVVSTALSRRHIDLHAAGLVTLLGVVDDPVDSVRFTIVDMLYDTIGAIREQARIAASNAMFHDRPRAHVIARNTSKGARHVVVSVVTWLQVQLDADRLESLVDSFGGPADAAWTLEKALQERSTYHLPLNRLSEVVTAGDAALTRQIVSPLVLAAISTEIAPVTWGARLFRFGLQRKVEPWVASAMGVTRTLFHGPDLHLVTGTWTCKIVLTFSAEAIGTPFTLAVFAAQDLIAKVMLQPVEPGTFEGVFTLQHSRPERSLDLYFNGPLTSNEKHLTFHSISLVRTSVLF